MTDTEKLNAISLISGETDQTTLSTYLMLAEQKLLDHAYPYGERPATAPSEWDAVVIDATSYLLLRRGSEGERQHNEQGLQRTYASEDLPYSITRRIMPKVGVL